MNKILFLFGVCLIFVGCVVVSTKPMTVGVRSVITQQSSEGENGTISRNDSTDSVVADKTNTAQTDAAVSVGGDVTKQEAAKTVENKKSENDKENIQAAD